MSNYVEKKFRRLCEKYGVDIDKIYNDGFNFEQAKVIVQAKDDVFISTMYDTKYDADQMFQIYLSHIENDNLTCLVNETFTAEQMMEIRLGYFYFLCNKQYVNAKYTAEQLKQIRIGLENGIDVSGYADVNKTPKDMEYMRRELMKSITIDWSDFIDCTQNMAIELHKLFMDGVNIGVFCDEYDLSVDYIKELGELLDKNPDLNYYLPLYDTLDQLEEIDVWLQHRLDPDLYLKGQYNSDQMRQIRLGLENCVDITKYNGIRNGITPVYTAEEMKKLRINLIKEY